MRAMRAACVQNAERERMTVTKNSGQMRESMGGVFGVYWQAEAGVAGWGRERNVSGHAVVRGSSRRPAGDEGGKTIVVVVARGGVNAVLIVEWLWVVVHDKLGTASVPSLGLRLLVLGRVGQHDAVLVAQRALALNLVLALDQAGRNGAAHGLDA